MHFPADPPPSPTCRHLAGGGCVWKTLIRNADSKEFVLAMSSIQFFVIFRLSIRSIRSELEKDPSDTLPAFWGQQSPKLDRNGQQSFFPQEPKFSCSAPIEHIEYNKDLKKLEYRHTKDFAIGRIFLEMFIVQYASTGKMDSWKKSRTTWKIKFLKYLFPCSDSPISVC